MTSIHTARRSLLSGPYLPLANRREARRVLIVALTLDDQALTRLVEELVDLQLLRADFKPIMLVTDASSISLSRLGLQFETTLTREHWTLLRLPGSYEDYLGRRVGAARQLYKVASVITVDIELRAPLAALV
ncbi:MAG: hypothetical protein EA388_04085 [Nitriliruptor sp.]|nr:MAG: hypothetical protein EA388_04085 [Nitriliruptor sp.]